MDAGAIANWRMDAALSEIGHETAFRTQGTERSHTANAALPEKFPLLTCIFIFLYNRFL